MPSVDKIPRHASKAMIPGLKVGDLVQTLREDYSQSKGGFDIATLPAGSVGRVKKIFDFGANNKHQRFLVDIKVEKHPLTNFYSEELKKVRV